MNNIIKMDPAEGEEMANTFLQHSGDQYLLSSGVDEDTEDSRDGSDDHNPGVLREQDRFLPIANVARLMKRSIPVNGKIAKDARECVQECVSEFVSFITSEASDRCHTEKRKTINGEDILFAMSSLGFDNYVEPLKIYLQKYREANKGDKALGGIMEGSAGSILSDTNTSDSASAATSVAAAPTGTVVFTYTDVNQIQQLQQQQQSTATQEFSLE